MLVRLTPPGGHARVFRVRGGSRSWHIDGGCATATVPLRLSGNDLERVTLARVDIFGANGLDWSGMVWRRPREGEPLECAGLANALTFERRAALYADTQFLGDLKDWVLEGRNAGAFDCTIEGGTVTMGQSPGTTADANDFRGYYYMGDTPLTRLDFSANVNHADVRLLIRGLDASGTPFGTDYIKTATGTQTGQSLVFDAGTYGFRMLCYVEVTPSTPSRYDKWVKVWDMTLRSTSITSVTPEAVLRHVCDALPAWVLPAGAAYRAHIGVSGVAIDSLSFRDVRTDDKAKADAVVRLVPWHFGFYSRRVEGAAHVVPVFEPIETTPSLALDVTRLTDESLRDRSADALASEYIVSYRDEDGRTRYVTVADESTANYLNRIGYEITGVVDASFTSSASLAATAGQAVAEEAHKQDSEGTALVLRARLANGRRAPAMMCMPGRMVRVRGMGPSRRLTIVSAEASDRGVQVTFSRTSTDLEYLARKAASG